VQIVYGFYRDRKLSGDNIAFSCAASPAPSNFNNFFLPATGDQTFTLNNLLAVKSVADHYYFTSCPRLSCAFTILATVALVLMPVLCGLAILLLLLHQNQQTNKQLLIQIHW
jgi:hypothetical protein